MIRGLASSALPRGWIAAVAAGGLACAGPATASGDPPAWSRPVAPFRIVGPIAYVGAEGLGAYLIRTDAGLILIDGTLPGNAPTIERSIVALGHRLSEVKLLLLTHAHFDHAGGLARLKRDTGARLLASLADTPALESGEPPSDTTYGIIRFPPVAVDGAVIDGQPVRLGGVTLTPLLTPGHTPGCTSWTTTVRDAGRRLRVIFPCSLTVAGNRLVGNRGYPGIVADFRRSFARLRKIRADVMLPGHVEQADLLARARRAAAGDQTAFVDPALWPGTVAAAALDFEADLLEAKALDR